MVKISVVFSWVLAWVFFALPAWSAELVAQVDGLRLQQSKPFVLMLTLQDAVPSGDPDLTPLDPFFEVGGERKGRATLMVNGQVQEFVTWHYQLKAKRSGRLTIPSLAVMSDKGWVRSKSMVVDVAQQEPQAAAKAVLNGKPDLQISTTVSNTTPYVGETVGLAVTILRGPNVMDGTMGKPEGNNMRIESGGATPEVSHVNRGGERWMQSVFRFTLTPLKEGRQEIKPVGLQGVMVVRVDEDDEAAYDPAFDPLAALTASLTRGKRVQEFEEFSAPLALDVKPVAAGWSADASRWLPVRHLALTQELVAKSPAVGQPITRELTVEMLGANPGALPSLEALLREGLDGKIWQLYAAKPVESSRYDPAYQTVRSTVVQQFTYVPLVGGQLMLPRVTLPWWSLDQGKMEHAVAMEEMLQVAGEGPKPAVASVPVALVAEPGDSSVPWFWVAVVLLFLSGGLLAGWWLAAPKKQADARPWQGKKKPVKLSPLKRVEVALAKAEGPKALLVAAEEYVRVRFGLGGAESLSQRVQKVGEWLPPTDAARLLLLARELEGAAFGKDAGGLAFGPWKQDFRRLCDAAAEGRPDGEERVDRFSLNF